MFAPAYGGTSSEAMLIDLLAWRSIGVKTVVINVTNDSYDLGRFVSAARLASMKLYFGSFMPNFNAYNETEFVSKTKELAQTFIKYNPDGWYISIEVGLGVDPPVLYVSGKWTLASPIYRKSIDALLTVKEIPFIISPYYITWGSYPLDHIVRTNWTQFVSDVSQSSRSVISALQDGVGCDYNNPRRKVGSESHQDFLRKAQIHKEVNDSYGWKSSVNIELFDTYSGSNTSDPATPTRIKAQIESENRSDCVSESLGLGPCCEGTGVSPRQYDSAWYPHHVDVFKMLCNL